MTGSGGYGTGSGGSGFDARSLDFSGVPYGSNDFNCCNSFGAGNCDSGARCYTSSCDISDYNKPQEVIFMY